MPFFVLLGFDGPEGRARRKDHRPAHLEHVAALDDAGRIRFAGPLMAEDGGPAGSVIVFEAADLDDARDVAARDPYVTRGIFGDHQVWATETAFPASAGGGAALFAFVGFDGVDAPGLRDEHEAAHGGFLRALVDDGLVRFDGPLLDREGSPRGSVTVFEAADLVDARNLVALDPFVAHGVFSEHEVWPTRTIFPASERQGD